MKEDYLKHQRVVNMSVNIFAMNISERLNSPVDDWLSFFSFDRRKKILSYRFNVDRNRTLWAELLARYIVSESFSCPIEKVQVYRDAFGKPHIAEFSIEISLSHAGDWVVCSFGNKKSGVDVEIDSTDAEEIAEKFFFAQRVQENLFFVQKFTRTPILDVLDAKRKLFQTHW